MKKTPIWNHRFLPRRGAGLVIATVILGSLLAPTGSRAQAPSPVVTNLWRLPAAQEYDYVGTNANNNVRGVAINPVTGNVIYATRDASNHLAVVAGTNGAVIARLSGTGISSGTLALSQVKVADDGAIYAADLAAASSTLKIYRWDSDSTTNDPLVVFQYSGVTTRFGDTMDLRGVGTNTQIIIAGSGGNAFALFTTADGTNFNGHEYLADYMAQIALPTGLAAGDVGKGIAFDGTNNAFYAKKDGSAPIRYVSYDPVGLTATLVTNVSLPTTPETRLVGLDTTTTNGITVAAGVLFGSGTTLQSDQHRVRVWNISNPSNPQLVADDPMPSPYAANGNAIGAADIRGNKIAVLEPNNGIAFYALGLVTNLPPSITGQPVGNSNILWGGYYTLTASAAGTPPLRYRWLLNGTTVPGATNASLTLTNLDWTNAGNYAIIVTNSSGSVTSAPAYVGVISSAASTVSTRLWARKPGDLPFLTPDNTQRGLAYNPVSGHLIVVSRAPTNGVQVLDAATGNYLWSLDMTGVGGVGGSVYDINMVAVADDGAVFVCDLTTSGSGFALYRWPDDSTNSVPYKIFEGDPGVSRVGDTFGAAGSGVGTTLMAASRNGTQVAVFNTYDGAYSWYSSVVDVTNAPAGFAGLGFYVTGTNEFWAKSGTFYLRHVTFDVANGTNEVTATLDAGVNTLNPIGIDSLNALVAGISSSETPHNLALYDVFGLSTNTTPAPLLDQEWFASENANGNGTGQVAVDTTGGRIFALDSNNGLVALAYAPPLRHWLDSRKLVLNWYGPAILQSATSVTGPYTDVTVVSRPYTNTAPGNLFFRLRR